MITVNGVSEPFSPGATVETLLKGRGLDPLRVAVERNGAIVPRASFAQAALADGDQIEIVHFVGGG